MRDLSHAKGRRSIWIDLLLYPTHTLPTAAAPVLVACGLALHQGSFRAAPAALALLCSWLVHVAGVLFDNHELLRRHPGLREHPELEDALADGSLSLAQLRLAILACLGAAIAGGIPLYLLAPGTTLLLGAIGILGSFWYAAGRWSAARLGLAAPLFFVMFGLVAVLGTCQMQAVAALGPAAPVLPVLPAWLVGLPTGALVVNVLLIDEIRDRGFDARKGWRNAAVRHGPGRVRREIWLLTGFAYVAPLGLLALGFSAWVALPLLTLPLGLHVAWRVATQDGLAALFPLTPRAAYLALLHAALLGIGLAV